MQKLPEIKAAYEWFFERYEAELAELAKSNDIPGIDKMEARRDILERGIFVLMFGQFEAAVTLAFDNAVAKRSKNPDWKNRRGWDTSVLRGRKVPFETKLAMVLDSQSPSFSKIVHAYGIRNHCAHGGTTSAIVSIDALESSLYSWSGELRK